MTLLYNDPCFLRHETGLHPERAERIEPIARRLGEAGLDGRVRRVVWEPVSRLRLARVHSARYVDQIRSMAEAGGGEIGGETILSPASYEVALLAAGCVCDAAERVTSGEDSQALCLVRPPGHHALFDRAMGFCLLNNVAIAARTAVEELGLNRVLIIDWDVHHGNGTQAAFWEDPRVGFLSIHRWPFYPGTGDADETGAGDGLGTTLNLPVPYGIPRMDYQHLFARGLEKIAAKIRPELILLSAGFDTHRRDPIGSLGLETEDFIPLTESVLDVAAAFAGGKLISVLEGGYDPLAVAESVAVHLGEMVKRQEQSGG